METKYKIKLEKYEGKIRLRNYSDDNGQFKCTTPTSENDKEVVENLKGLMKKLNLIELNAEIELK